MKCPRCNTKNQPAPKRRRQRMTWYRCKCGIQYGKKGE